MADQSEQFASEMRGVIRDAIYAVLMARVEPLLAGLQELESAVAAAYPVKARAR